MIRLALICFLIAIIRSEDDCNFNINDVIEVKRLFSESERLMKDAIRGQRSNAAIVLGNARAGKSTLINYLIGNSLVVYKEGTTIVETKIKKANPGIQGPEIKAGSVSATSIPTRWTSSRAELANLDIWDNAGFDDNRGYMNDITNAFYLHHLTKNVDSLKFILVISLDDITKANVNQVLTLLSTLDRYFNSTFEDFFPSISVIISKAPERTDNRVPIDYTYLNYLLTDRLINPKLKMSDVSKDFLKHIKEHNERVGFFRKAKKLGRLTSNMDYNIIPAITNGKMIEKASHQNIGFTFSAKSRLCLNQCQLKDVILNMSHFIDFTAEMNKRYIEDMNYLNESSDKPAIRQKKVHFQEIYNHIDLSSLHNSDINMKIDILKRSHDLFKEFITKTNLMNKISLTEFIDSLIGTGKIDRIDKLLRSIIKILYDRTAILIAYCQYKVNVISEAEMEKVREDNERRQAEEVNRLQNEIDKIKPKEEKSFWDTILMFLRDVFVPKPYHLRMG